MKSTDMKPSFYGKVSGPYYWIASLLGRRQQKAASEDSDRRGLREICGEKGRPDLYDGLSKLIVIDRESYAGYIERYENEADRPLSRAKSALNIDHDEAALASSLADYRLAEEDTTFAVVESAPKVSFEIEEIYRQLTAGRSSNKKRNQ